MEKRRSAAADEVDVVSLVDVNQGPHRVLSVQPHGSLHGARAAIVRQRFGGFHCSLHRGSDCAHVTAARQWLFGIDAADDEANAEMIRDEADDAAQAASATEAGVELDDVDGITSPSSKATTLPGISKLPVNVPLWAVVPDTKLLDYKVDVTAVTKIMGAGAVSEHVRLKPHIEQCTVDSCRSTRLTSIPPVGSGSAHAVCYSSTRCVPVIVRDLQCEDCNTRYVYDGRDDLVFVWSHTIVFTHEVLDGYAAAYTASATSFNAYAVERHRKYSDCYSPVKFVSLPTFQHAFFAFIRLQQWCYDFSCPFGCGSEPKHVLADGVMVSMPREFVNTLTPPTLPTAESPTFTQPKWLPSRFLPDASTGSLLCRAAGAVYERDKKGDFEPLAQEEENQLMAYLDAKLPPVAAFRRAVLVEPDLTLRTLYRRVLRVLGTQESVLQFMRWPCPKLIFKLSSREVAIGIPGVRQSLGRLCPLVLLILNHFASSSQQPPELLFDLLRCVAERAVAVFNDLLLHHDPHPADPPAGSLRPDSEGDAYRVTGTYYGANPKRLRPFYPNMREKRGEHTADGQVDQFDESPCKKFFATARKLTGGIMVFWCRSVDHCCVDCDVNCVFGLQSSHCCWISHYSGQ